MIAIASRTPEGEPNHCPTCGGQVIIEPSLETRDAPCPWCGCLLWFLEPLREQTLQEWLDSLPVPVLSAEKAPTSIDFINVGDASPPPRPFKLFEPEP